MHKRVIDINSKVAYLTNVKTGPKLKTKRPLALRNTISSRRQEADTSACHEEMGALLDCLHANNFFNARCSKFIESLMKCEKAHMAETAERTVAARAEGKTIDGRVDKKIVNRLLQRHPTVTNKQAVEAQKNLLNTFPRLRIQPSPHVDTGRPFKSSS